MAESSLDKMLSILDLYESDQLHWTPEEIASQLSMSRSTLYRYLRTLSNRGYLVSTVDDGYTLGPKISLLEYRLRMSDPLIVVGGPLAEEMVRQFDGAALISRVFREGFVCIYRSKSLKDSRHYFKRGQIMQLVRGANAHAIQAFLPRHRLERLFFANREEFTAIGMGPDFSDLQGALRPIRNDGVCVSDGELRSGVAAVAAPIFDSRGAVLGSFSFTIPKSMLGAGQLEAIVERVKFSAGVLNQKHESRSLDK